MSEDLRCCGSGTCIIDNEGRCWCGQQWDGQKMVHPSLPQAEGPVWPMWPMPMHCRIGPTTLSTTLLCITESFAVPTAATAMAT